MEVMLSENGNNGKDGILASKSNGTSDMPQSTNIAVHDGANLVSEACDHFSIRYRKCTQNIYLPSS
jgi:hypothetical protein